MVVIIMRGMCKVEFSGTEGTSGLEAARLKLHKCDLYSFSGSLSGCQSTYDSSNWTGSFCSLNLSKIWDCRSLRDIKISTGCRSLATPKILIAFYNKIIK